MEYDLKSLSMRSAPTVTISLMPLEVLKHLDRAKITESWDVWSYGLLFFIILPPGYQNTFQGSSSNISNTAYNRANNWTLQINDNLYRTMAQNCLVEDPSERISCTMFFGWFKEQVMKLFL